MAVGWHEEEELYLAALIIIRLNQFAALYGLFMFQ